jgi:hypothetical protein
MNFLSEDVLAQVYDVLLSMLREAGDQPILASEAFKKVYEVVPTMKQVQMAWKEATTIARGDFMPRTYAPKNFAQCFVNATLRLQSLQSQQRSLYHDGKHITYHTVLPPIHDFTDPRAASASSGTVPQTSTQYDDDGGSSDLVLRPTAKRRVMDTSISKAPWHQK